MASSCRVAIVSDIHYACAAEQARGSDYEYRDLPNPFLKFLLGAYRRFIWLRHPTAQGRLLDDFIRRASADAPDYVIANGDYSCDSGFIGLCDEAACQSVRECLGKLRGAFGPKFRAVYGDHELGKCSFIGKRGGMRVASFHRAQRELLLEPFWRFEIGNHVLIGVTSSLIALSLYEADARAEEMPEWRELRERHMREIRAAFSALKPGQRVLFFCHDPSALPFLLREDAVREKISQIDRTVVGHLHTKLIFWESRVLAGMPRIGFLGHTARRMTGALNHARYWKPFKPILCPAVAGIELLKDGGYLTADLDLEGSQPARFKFHPLPR